MRSRPLSTSEKTRLRKDAEEMARLSQIEHRPLGPDRWYHSLLVEKRFSVEFNLPRQPQPQPEGDPGWDFVLYTGDKVDTKGSLKQPHSMPVEVNKPVKADIYVLGQINDDDCELVGWMRWDDIKTFDVGKLTPKGIDSHLVPVTELHPMDELLAIHIAADPPDPERFQMVIDGEVWDVSINHANKAVKINGVILRFEDWMKVQKCTPAQARATIRTMKTFDGELIDE